MNQNKNCFVYKWTHLPTMMWYIGSHTSINAHPDDGYICSSKIIKPLILSNPHEWHRTIIDVGGAEEMYQLETEILRLFDAKNDPRSYNRHNNYGVRINKLGIKEKPETCRKKSLVQLGKKRPQHAAKMKGRIGHWRNKTRPEQRGENNPASKCYIIIPPNEEAYEVWAIKSYAEKMNWPMGTVWDIVHGKYIPKRGKLKGYQIKIKE